jgi:hypothetical protein
MTIRSISFASLKVTEMSLVQLCSFGTHCFLNENGGSRCYLKKEDIVDWLEPYLEKPLRWDEELSFKEVKEKVQELFPGSFPFDQDRFIPSFSTYVAEKEEENAEFSERSLPLLGEKCKIYPSLKRMVYKVTDLVLLDDACSNAPSCANITRYERISFKQYNQKLCHEQKKIAETLENFDYITK